jgi:transcription initiation factor TFIIIB Brf1 subunit/transcription initiation factor TFIIB
MLRIYICPKCYNFRMVSRKPDAICLHCGEVLDQCEIEYGAYINMTENDRNEYRENYKKRMTLYNDKMLRVRSINDKETFL